MSTLEKPPKDQRCAVCKCTLPDVKVRYTLKKENKILVSDRPLQAGVPKRRKLKDDKDRINIWMDGDIHFNIVGPGVFVQHDALLTLDGKECVPCGHTSALDIKVTLPEDRCPNPAMLYTPGSSNMMSSSGVCVVVDSGETYYLDD